MRRAAAVPSSCDVVGLAAAGGEAGSGRAGCQVFADGTSGRQEWVTGRSLVFEEQAIIARIGREDREKRLKIAKIPLWAHFCKSCLSVAMCETKGEP